MHTSQVKWGWLVKRSLFSTYFMLCCMLPLFKMSAKTFYFCVHGSISDKMRKSGFITTVG
jgi:hypothetical protein